MDISETTSEVSGEEPDGATEGTSKKPWRFPKGMSGNPGGQPKNGRSKSRLLKDMQAVYGQEKSKDRGPGQRNCRKLLESNHEKFLSQLARLEQLHSEDGRKPADSADPPPPGKEDFGEEKALGMVERLLEEWREGRER